MITEKEELIPITIDGQEIRVAEGTTVLQASRQLGMEIPTMCYEENCKPQTSCLMCVVKINGNPNVVPSCSRPVEPNMVVESECEEVQNIRKTAIELILSDHLGDCVAPCQTTCPAKMEIPQMLRQVNEGDYLGALKTVKRDIPMPGVLGRICPEVCENNCRRGSYDEPIAICLVKRFVADEDLFSENAFIPEIAPATGKHAAIIGSGPAGLSAAYYLLEKGHAVTIIDAASEPGGSLRYKVPKEDLPVEVLNREIELMQKMGLQFRLDTKIGIDVTLDQIRDEFDAVFLASGMLDEGDAVRLGFAEDGIKLKVDRTTLQTEYPDVFAGGAVVRRTKLSIQSVADGKLAAISLDQYMMGTELTGRKSRFNSRVGKVSRDEVSVLKHSYTTEDHRVEPCGVENKTKVGSDGHAGLDTKESHIETPRCLHCDCRAKDNCDLRDYSELLGADQNHFRGPRRQMRPLKEGDKVHLEVGKCIACGLCVQIAQDYKEEIGLAYEGRGFNTTITVPFGKTLSEALQKSAFACEAACPTGAIQVVTDDPTQRNPWEVFPS